VILGRVVGELWATRCHAGLDGRKLLIIRPHYWYGPAFAVANLIAVDSLGAGVGEDVLVCLGEPARRSLTADVAAVAKSGSTEPGYADAAWQPVDAAVMAIVDGVELDGSATMPTARPLQAVPSTRAVAASAPGVDPR
jgi:ethanolamine utilization protein EutN